MNETTPVVADEDAAEAAEAALSTVDSEFGRTTDPVRMYMREMGTVDLLTREDEIVIAKRIEEGLKHMIQAISACPATIAEILALADKVAREEPCVDEVIDGFIDAEEKSWMPNVAEEEDEEEEDEDEEDEEEDDGEALLPPIWPNSKSTRLNVLPSSRSVHQNGQGL